MTTIRNDNSIGNIFLCLTLVTVCGVVGPFALVVKGVCKVAAGWNRFIDWIV